VRAACHAVVFTVGAGSAFAQPPAPHQPVVDTFRSGLAVLTLEASVRDADGRPVLDLQPSEFTVRIDGQPRPVVAARLFGRDTAPAANASTTPRFTRVVDAPPGRLLVFAVDRESMRSGSEKAALEAAAQMLGSLSASDAVGALALPGAGVEFTRDHAVVADALRKMTGTAPTHGWPYALSWDEALAFERRDSLTTAHVVERECTKGGGMCPAELSEQSRDMLSAGRGRAQTVLTGLTDLLDRLRTLRAPKHLVLLSGGLPFDMELLSRYQALAAKAAQAHVAVFVLHLDQSSFDASDRRNVASISGRQYATGLGNIAASTGGAFYSATGRAAGPFDRILGDITSFYQLGLESRPSDADGKPHRVDVTVSRPNAHVRAPASTSIDAAPARNDDALARALTEPTEVAELPLEVATYATHSVDPTKVRLVVAAGLSADSHITPREWGYVITEGGTVIGGRRIRVDSSSPESWSAADTIEIPPGHYRLRTAIVDEERRMGVLDVPLQAALRTAAGVLASDLIVGAITGSTIDPRPHVRQGQVTTAMIELSSAETLEGTTGVLEITRAGTEAIARQPLQLRTRETDKRIVMAEARLDFAGTPPGTYQVSALIAKDATPFARVSRIVEVVAGVSPKTAAAALPSTMPSRDPELDTILQRVGRYVSEYGEQASVIVGVEHYDQRYADAPLGEPSSRRLVAELALTKTADATGWLGFRDVFEVDRKPIRDRQDRLQALFRAGLPDLSEARRIADESARFNIGPTRRNFNEPTSTLFFLLPATQSRFAFRKARETRVGGVDAWEIEFQEKTSPTLIRTTDGRSVASRGTIWVAPEDGTVLRTKLVLSGFQAEGSFSTLDVTYALDSRLGLWLPSRMAERHEGIVRRVKTASRAIVTATATYSDFKRFEASSTFK
jgi:VWFA-related protein